MAETSTETRALTAYTPAAPTPLTPPAVPAPRTTPAPKFGLAWRIFLGTAAVVVIVLAVTLAVASIVASRNADRAIQTELEQTNERINDMLLQQRAAMLGTARLFAEQVGFRSAVDAAKASGDTASLYDQAVVADSALRASRAQIIDDQGTLLARSDDPAAEHVSVAGSALISGALEGQETQGFAVADSMIAQAVAVPITGAGNSLTGVLMALSKIDDSVAAGIGRQTGSELVFYVIPNRGAPILALAPARLGSMSELQPAIEHSMMARGVDSMAVDQKMMMAKGERKEITINGRHYVGQRFAALSASGSEVGGFIALRDKDEELAGYYKLRNALLATGAAGLLLAFVLSLAIARQIVRPVGALATAAQRASEGDYAAEIPATSGDEIGVLATAFNRLLADLREKQSLVEFLQNPSGGRTVPLLAVTPTMQQAMGSAAALEPGQTLALRYEIKSVLGVGGMGVVYKASDRELGEVVAIKTLKPDVVQHDASALDRFKTEIKLARKIAHRNVVRTYDLGETGGVYFITMEFVDGKSLKELIVSRGRLPVSVALSVGKQLCRALEVAHDEGIIHRDIKPQNMVVQPDGVLKVMDFGIARLAQRTNGHTQAGMVVGTPEYMAPEQLLGDEIDARADLYAAGAVIYECLTGRLPHEADTPITLITRVLEETPRPPRELQPEVPPALSDIVLRTLSRDRDRRPRTAAELGAWLERVG